VNSAIPKNLSFSHRSQSTLVALVAIASLQLPLTGQVHWLGRAFWIVTTLFSLTSVAFSYKHLELIDFFHLADEFDDCLVRILIKDNKLYLFKFGLLCCTKFFYQWSLIAYIIGLGIYLGSIWRNGLDADARQFDSLNIFIVFCIFTASCTLVYFGLSRHPHELKDWEKLNGY
jgi:hypothetical protein